MRALRFTSFGDPSVLELAEVAVPAIAATTALVRVMAASINPSDVKNVAGAMKQTTLPRIPGREISPAWSRRGQPNGSGPPSGGPEGIPDSRATALMRR